MLALALVALGLLPFAVLLTKPLKRHSHARVRALGTALATLGLWITFNLGLTTVFTLNDSWQELFDDAARDLVFTGIPFALLQVLAVGISARVARASVEPRRSPRAITPGNYIPSLGPLLGVLLRACGACGYGNPPDAVSCARCATPTKR